MSTSHPIIAKAIQAVRPVFRLNWNDGIHAVAHWSRVWHHGRHIAQAMEINDDILAWFAFLHDSQRHNDHIDPQHGRRAADFAVQLRADGILTELDHREFEWLCEAMRLHSDGHTTGEPAVCACWDADRLDLGRVGIEPDPSRLCTDPARDPQVIRVALRLSRRE
jgi:uncharacterized protein